MKKVQFKKRILSVFLLVLPLLFSSCNTFVNGGVLKDTLDKVIALANAPVVSVRIHSEKSETVPSGDTNIKVGETVSILSSPYLSYEFVKWQVLNRETEEVYSEAEYSEFLDMENPLEKETKITLKKEISNLLIQPLCVVRPQVLSNSPSYTSSGVYRDARIQVMFDQKMDVSSIYYTADELADLRIQNVEKLLYDETSGTKPTSVNSVTMENCVYGYKNDRNEIFYKNIIITNRDGENILKNFMAPVFESADTLVVPADKDNPPLTGSQIIVTINQNFNYCSGSRKVTMSDVKKWNYMVNSATDSNAPVVAIALYNSADRQGEITNSLPITNTSDLSAIPYISGPLYLFVSETDADSGPTAKFKIEATKTHDASYKAVGSKNTKTTEVSFNKKVSTTEQRFGEETAPSPLDLHSLITGDNEPFLDGDGIYDFAFIFRDDNANTTTWKYSFCVDTTAPEISSCKISSDKPENKLSATWTYSSSVYPDYEKAILKYRVSGSDDEYESLEVKANKTATIPSLKNGTKYDVIFNFYDIHGNYSEKALTEWVRPAYVSGTKLEQNSENKSHKLDYTFTFPSTGCDGALIFYGTSSSIPTFCKKVEFDKDNLSPTVTLPETDLTPGTEYYVGAYTYAGDLPDDMTAARTIASTYSDGTTKYCTTKPYPVTNLSVGTRTTTSISLSWNKPASGTVSGYKVYKKDITAGDTSFTEVKTTSQTNYTVDFLKPSHKYEFKVESYSYNYSYLSDSVTIQSYTLPNAVTGLTTAQYYGGGSADNQSKIKLSWTKPVGDYDGIYIYYRVSGSSTWTKFNTTAYKTETSTTVTGLSAGTKYYFKAVTYGLYADNTSEAISSARLTAPSCPTNVRLKHDNGQGRIVVTWTNSQSTTWNDIWCNSNQCSSSITYSGNSAYCIMDIAGFKRNTDITISIFAGNNSADCPGSTGASYLLSYKNVYGNFIINGNSIDYSELINATTSSVTIPNQSSGVFSGGSNRSITLSPYSMGKYEVTNDLFWALFGAIPSKSGYTSGRYPVQKVNWYHAIAFCNKLSAIFGYEPYYTVGEKTKKDWETFSFSDIPTSNQGPWEYCGYNISSNGYRLPTECQWEFAARGGNVGDGSWNSCYAGAYSTNPSDTYYLGNVAWFKDNSGDHVHYVGEKGANQLGFYDMSGNVWEWTSDIYNGCPNQAFTDPVWMKADYNETTTTLCKTKEQKIYQKGGGYSNGQGEQQVTARNCFYKYDNSDNNGMRICRNAVSN